MTAVHQIKEVREVIYQSGNGGEDLIGFEFLYEDGVVYPIGPILIRAEYNALVKDAYEKGYAAGQANCE